MTKLEHRALLGDKAAQEECARQWIMLPCPFCGSKDVKTFNWGMWRCWCLNCFAKSDDRNLERDAIALWNARPAPLPALIGEIKEEKEQEENRHENL